ncbi:hypothetical protein [Saccharothrix sp. HUAS TT1]|uniref:hypothetical protein n=1 Tax=unclassified Saccharothrix TaxID=2593673 RepID=UPI00345B4F1A
MSVQGDGRPPDRGSFDKATVDRWQVFGGMAGVAALLLSIIGGIQDLVPLSLVAAGVVTLVGVWLLYRWGRRPQQRLARHFALPTAITIVGAATAGLLGGLELRPTPGTALPGGNPSTTTADVAPASDPAAPTGGATTTHVAAAPTTTTAAPVGAGPAEFRSGRVTLTSGYYIDLDSKGESGGVTGDSSSKVDLHYISSLFAEQIAPVATSGSPPSYQDCVSATALNSSIDASAVEQGAAFCLKTTEGRWARVVVVSAEVYQAIEFDLVVWEKQP